MRAHTACHRRCSVRMEGGLGGKPWHTCGCVGCENSLQASLRKGAPMRRRDFMKLSGLTALGPFRSSAAADVPGDPDKVSEPVATDARCWACRGDRLRRGTGRRFRCGGCRAEGAKTLLLENNGCLGGIWTAGLLAYMLDTSNKGGLMREILTRIAERESAARVRGKNRHMLQPGDREGRLGGAVCRGGRSDPVSHPGLLGPWSKETG